MKRCPVCRKPIKSSSSHCHKHHALGENAGRARTLRLTDKALRGMDGETVLVPLWLIARGASRD